MALGSNVAGEVGAPEDMVRRAVVELERAGLAVSAVSPLYRTPAWPPGSGPDFVNAACLADVAVETGAAQLLALLHAVERRLGRHRAERWGPRTIDLDLLAIGGRVVPDAGTQTRWRKLSFERQRSEAPDAPILPHPRLQDRAFVLVPLADIAPSWRHPVTGRTVQEMLAGLPADATAGVRRI